MKLTKKMLDMNISQFEDCISQDMTYRQWINDYEMFYELDYKDLDSMTDKNLNNYFEYLDYLTSN